MRALNGRNDDQLERIVDGGKRVFNQYGAMRVVPAKRPNVENKGSCAPHTPSE